jgi:hypothetical protein
LFGVFPLTFLSICVLFQSADDLAPREKRIMTQVSILIRPRLVALVMLLPFHQQGIEGGVFSLLVVGVRPSLPIESINIRRRPAAGPMNGMVIETDVDDSPINYPAQIRRWHKSRILFISSLPTNQSGGILVSLSLFYLGSLLPALHNKDITNTIGN